SGCGKTTLLRTLALLEPGATGRVRLDGTDSSSFTPQHWRARVTLLPQSPALVRGTVAENLLLPYSMSVRAASGAPDEGRMRALLDDVGLDDVELTRDVSRLSLGQKARVALVRTIVTDPDVLLLDEADASLDTESMERIGELTARYVGEGHRGCLRIRHRDPDRYTMRRLAFGDGTFVEEDLS
ncbi:MAG: ATP-binding cassette domain-containing protein, partial [Atopobiaceae bacterium]|nr:ATP-binding cassette domain-containing protein [Atopobiaceae bacterium]